MEIFIQPTNDSFTSTDDKEVASPDFENGFTDTGRNVYSFYMYWEDLFIIDKT